MLQDFVEISAKKRVKSSLAAIKVLINRHQRIIDLSDNIEDLFSNVALLQFVWNTLVICCIGFLIVIVSCIILLSFLSLALLKEVIHLKHFNIEKAFLRELALEYLDFCSDTRFVHFHVAVYRYAGRSDGDNEVSHLLRRDNSRGIRLLLCRGISQR